MLCKGNGMESTAKELADTLDVETAQNMVKAELDAESKKEEIEMTQENNKENRPPYRCMYCGAPSWLEPSEQSPPPDYCHESDHGEPDEVDEGGNGRQ